MRRVAVLALAVLALAACDRGARKDLPQSNQNLVSSDADIFLFPDKFPNIAHRCEGTTGMWTVVNDWVWIVYNDPRCGGTGPMTVLDNVPGNDQQPAGE